MTEEMIIKVGSRIADLIETEAFTVERTSERMMIQGYVSLPALGRIAIATMRDPTPKMQAAVDDWESFRPKWEAMIDAALRSYE